MKKTAFGLLFTAFIVIFLHGCSLVKPIPDNFTISINTSSDLNPDADDRSSPVVLRIYQLQDPKLFNETDFFDIYDEDKEHLAESLVKKQEMELNPNESRKLELVLDEKTTTIGILVAFRDIDSAKWRETIAVRARQGSGIPVFSKRGATVDLQKNKIVISK